MALASPCAATVGRARRARPLPRLRLRLAAVAVAVAGAIAVGVAVAVAPHAAAEPLTLAQAVAEARRHAPRIDVAAAQLGKAEALIKQAWSLLLPTLQTQFTYTHWDFEVAFEAPRPDGTGMDRLVIQRRNQLDAHNSISVNLFNYSALPLLRNAYDNVDIHEQQVRATERAVGFQAAAAVVQIIASQRAVHLAEADLRYFEAHLRAEQRRLEGGVGNRLAVIRSEAEVTSSRHRLADAERAVQFAKESLALLMRRSDLDFEIVDYTADLPPLDPHEASAPEALVREGLQRREDVTSTEAAIVLADRDVDASWGDFLPRLDASFNHTWTNAPAFAGVQNRWNVMLSATWTWFDGGLRYGQLDEKRAARAEAIAQLAATQEQARAEILDAHQRWRDAASRLIQAEESVTVARQALEAADRLFEGGLADYLSRFDAKQSARQAELAVLSSRAQVDLAQLSLLQAIGISIGRR